MQLHDLMAKLFELRQVAADQAKDGPSGSGAMARALTAYEWLGDNIEAFVDSLDPEMTEGPASQTEGMGGDAVRDRLPAGHVVLEQADMMDGTGRVAQTVSIGPEGAPGSVEYQRIVHADEAYGAVE